MRYYFDKKQLDNIIKEYLGIDTEYLKELDNKQLKKDIKKIIRKYKKDKRNIQYILECDLRYAYDNEKDIKVIETINGIVVYENLI